MIRSPSTGDIPPDFDAMYREELPRVYNFLLYQVGDRQAAEDLTSETFEKAWRHRGRYRKDLAAFSTWLFTIARRSAADHFRRHRPTVLVDEDEPSGEDAPEVVVQRSLDLAVLAGLLATLPVRER